MRRRRLMAAALGAALAAPHISRAARTDVLKFVPQTDLATLDPIWSTLYVTRNHAYLIFDTLYGQDAEFQAQPQMVAGHVTEDEGKIWTLTLRDGLRFHDGTPVLGRDVVASLRRWAQRDGFGSTLMARTAELTAPTDTTIRFRLTAPFPLLPDALGKSTALPPVIMPERLARTDAFTRIQEMVGSGPYRFRADEQVPGARYVYERFDGYQPRSEPTNATAGAKTPFFPRVEWHVIPDDATASAALQSGEVDWWERVTADIVPSLRRHPDLVTRVMDPTGSMAIWRPNHTQPPFDNPAIRRAMLGAVDQAEFMQAAAGSDPAMWKDRVGVFCPQSPLANDAGLDVLTSPRNFDQVKRALAAAGYGGETVVNVNPGDHTDTHALGDMTTDMLRKSGMTVDDQVMDSASSAKLRVSKKGWNCFCTTFAGADFFNPAAHLPIRGNGDAAWSGWAVSTRLEALRNDWFAAPNLAVQQQIARQMQLQAWEDVPYIPLGQIFRATSFNKSLSGVQLGFPVFYGVRRV